jgi:hypothetical protein
MDKLNSKDKKKLLEVLKQLESEPNCSHFINNVDWKKLKLYDYPKIVKKPMSINKIRRRVQNKAYLNINEFWNDVMLIWSNCKLYNGEGSVISY